MSQSDQATLEEAERKFPGREKLITMPYMGIPASVQRMREAGEAEVANASWMLPSNREVYRRRLKALREARYDRSNPKEYEVYANRLRAAYSNPVAAAELAAYRTFEITNDVMASPFALGTFQAINLSADELPLILTPRSRNLQRFTVRSQALDGGSRSIQWRTAKSILTAEIDLMATDKVEYSLRDLQQGDVAEADAVNRELQYDLDMKVDGLALAQVDAAKTVSGLRALLNVHPSVIPANIPDTNYLDLTNVGTYGVLHKLTIERLKAILNHISLFGAADPTQALSMTQIVISPQNVRDPWDYISLVSGWDSSGSFGQQKPTSTVPEAMRDQIFSSGMISQAWGHTFNWTPNSQLDVGKAYIFTNQPLGWFFTKTDFDRTIKYDESNSMVHLENNIGEIMLQKALAFYVPDLWKYRVIIVDF